MTEHPVTGTEPASDETPEPENGTSRLILRDIDNRDEDMVPYEFEGTLEQIIGYLDGPLRSDLRSPALSEPKLAAAIEAVRTGAVAEANRSLHSLGVSLRRPS